MSTLKGAFTKDPSEQTPQERIFALRTLSTIMGIAFTAIFVWGLIGFANGEFERPGSIGELKEMRSLTNGIMIGVAGIAFLALGFGKKRAYQYLMFLLILGGSIALTYIGSRYGSLTLQTLGIGGVAGWIVLQVISLLSPRKAAEKDAKKFLSGKDTFSQAFKEAEEKAREREKNKL